MIKILLVSENNTNTEKFNKIFNKNGYEFSVMTDETLICDIISVDPPDITIVDAEIPNIKSLNKKEKFLSYVKLYFPYPKIPCPNINYLNLPNIHPTYFCFS